VSSTTVYVLDANVFIEAAMRYYAFDLAPGFWAHRVAHGTAGVVCTIDRVDAEITGATPLRAWLDVDFAGFVRNSGTPDTLTHYAALMRWAQAQPFTPAARSEFATVADAWLVAYAKANGGTVVTHEVYEANRLNRIKVPNACRSLTVPFVNTFEIRLTC
jgi:hypothetical protein